MNDALPRRAALVFGVLDLVCAVAYAWLLFAVIPNRHAWFDVVAGGVCALLAAGGIGMLTRRRHGLLLAAVGCASLLLAGLALVWGLLASAVYLAGLYEGFGRGAAIVLAAIVALVFELVCLLPTVQLLWLRRHMPRRNPDAAA